eukprot:CAMPEP_0206481468 /NCGR_PEP_ID=MMETSP0324_2-20121206/38162_1 /ASSEMBLY_ACC=CAM_ASM_000836 /TAXON_ID=2866 /ORGANISM="Crypthecodinium cohnii, Strain Seligo" /LENGTH=87 /DNA_ID=CAMNT_0053958961 /DNA_START=578 /DNA_END=838 /DNA_ORIENTATION=-
MHVVGDLVNCCRLLQAGLRTGTEACLAVAEDTRDSRGAAAVLARFQRGRAAPLRVSLDSIIADDGKPEQLPEIQKSSTTRVHRSITR